jgi:NADP-dependent 3-hydroxy acid dehydrogenase YdfG
MIQKSILITGCSTGIGLVCALGLKDQGYRVFATARKSEDIKRLEALGLESFYLDYTESPSIQTCVAEISKRTGASFMACLTTGPMANRVPLKTYRAQF